MPYGISAIVFPFAVVCIAALLGSLIESLGAVKAQGMISTHLHQQLGELPLNLPRNAVAFKQMRLRRRSDKGSTSNQPPPTAEELEQQQLRLQQQDTADGIWADGNCDLIDGTWYQFELTDGICPDSNALHAAKRAGFSSAVLERAHILQQHFHCNTRGDAAVHRKQKLSPRVRQEQQLQNTIAAEGVTPFAATGMPASVAGELTALVQGRAASALLLQRKLGYLRQLLTDVSAYVLSGDRMAGSQLTRTSSIESSSSTSPQILLLPPPPQQLEPPPAWVGSACVYILVVLERSSSTSLATDRQQREKQQEGAAVEPLFGSFRVYVGESENVKERLKRHRQNPQWATASALVLRAQDKGHARSVEMQVIRMLNNDPEVILRSVKDGNRRSGGAPSRRLVEACKEQMLRLAPPDGNSSAPRALEP